MANLKEKLFGLVDNGLIVTKGLIDTMNETINSINWDEHFNSLMDMKDSLLEKGNELKNEFDELMKQIKDNISDFEVTVPFDEASGEKFDAKVDGNKLIVEVTFKDDTTERSNRNVVTIPSNCDVEKMEMKHNAVNKTMTVVIPKVLDEKKEAETPVEEPHTAESKLLKKFRENILKEANASEAPKFEMPRGANGRFVKRNKKAE